MRVMILDDEQGVLDTITYLFREHPSYEIVCSTTNPLEAMDVLNRHDVDVIFLDVEMPLINGLDFSERAREIDQNVSLVFITAYEQYAINAFNVSAVDYVLKPVTRTSLKRTIERIEASRNSRPTTPPPAPEQASDVKPGVMLGSVSGKFYIINVSEALYIEVLQRNVYVVTPERRYRLKYSITHWEDVLIPQGWFKTHRAYIVNLSMIESIIKLSNSVYTIRMKGCAEEIPVSRSYLAQFKKQLDL